jgi:hypothetical protein
MATIEQALEQVSVLLDQHVEKCVSAYEVILRDFGASDAELVAELARMRADCVEKRTRALSQVKAWLETCRFKNELDKLKKQVDVARAELDRGETTLQ